MASPALPLLDSFSALADPMRCRMLALLERQELTVSELCAVLQAPQSTVSRHLKTLADADWVSSRRDGTSRYYALARGGADGAHQAIWQLTRQQLEGRVGLDQDARRLQRVLARRSETSQQFFATSAGRWDHLREEMFGRDFATQALIGLLPREWIVGDLGCGTGALLPVLATVVARVIGVDASEDMLAAARSRTLGLSNVDLRHGSLEALPLDSASLDAATCMLVLHHVPSPAAAIAEAARVLKPGGRLLIVDMAPHDREEYRDQMGHVWLGFSETQLSTWLADAGFTQIAVRDLPTSHNAKGPSLLAATATTPGIARTAEPADPRTH
jgi:ArsR family transcriptional regulator